ncbi:MAG: YdbL family protein [Victivallaceae bacterium]|nr:YdbL family protein [Victivallaceae bacterium]
MFNKISIPVKIFAVCLLLGATFPVAAKSASEIKTAMKQRLSKVDEFKKSGVLGENNRGYLTVRVDNAEAKKLASDENADRKAVYEAIAKKTKADATQVGKQRAIKLIELGKSGEWFENAQGEWVQKK